MWARSESCSHHPYQLQGLQFVDEELFCALSTADRGLASFCGADLSKRAPLQNNPFLEGLRKQRNTAITAVMKKCQLDMEGFAAKSISKKVWIDDIPKVVDVACDGFIDDATYVSGVTVRMLSTAKGQEIPVIHVTLASLEFVRRGVHSTNDYKLEAQRKRSTEPPFPTYPQAKRTKAGQVYCVFRNADGVWKRKFQKIKRSDIPEFVTERELEAAKSAQQYHDLNHTEAADDELGEEEELEVDDEVLDGAVDGAND